MKVNKNQELARMEDERFVLLQEEYLKVKSKTHYLQIEYDRQKKLRDSLALSDKIYYQTEATLQENNITLAALVEKLKIIQIDPTNLNINNIQKNLAIHAPVNAFVSKINAVNGQYLNPSDVAFELVSLENLQLHINVFEKDIHHFVVGKKLSSYTNSSPNIKYESQVKYISKEVKNDGTIEVICSILSTDEHIFPGVFMNADLPIEFSDIMGLPQECIVQFEGKQYVIVQLPNNIFELKEIKKGIEDKQFAQIINYQDLENAKIIQEGAYTLLMVIKNTEEEE